MPSAPPTGDGSSSPEDPSVRVPPTAFTLNLDAVTYTYSSAHSFPVRPVSSPTASSSSTGSAPALPPPPAATAATPQVPVPGLPAQPEPTTSATGHASSLPPTHQSVSQPHLAPPDTHPRNSSSASSSSSLPANPRSSRSARHSSRPRSHNEQSSNPPHRSHRHRIVAGVGAAQEALRKEADRIQASQHAHPPYLPASDLRASSSVDVHRDLRQVQRGVRTRPRSPTNRSVRSVASAPGMFSDAHRGRATAHSVHSLHASSPDEVETPGNLPSAHYRSNTQPSQLFPPISLNSGTRRRRTTTHDTRPASSSSGAALPMSTSISGSRPLSTVPPSASASELASSPPPPPPYSPPRSGSPTIGAAPLGHVNGFAPPADDSTEDELAPEPDPEPEEAEPEDESTADETPGSSDCEDEGDVLVHIFVLHPLRLLASVPGLLGTLYLWRKCVMVALRNQDLRRIGDRSLPGALDYLTASGWSIATAFHALSMTTLLLRRWLLYYGLLPSLVRLVALQAISGALLQINLHKFFDPNQPLAAWVVASVTTSSCDVLVRWITSNIVDRQADALLVSPPTRAAAHPTGLAARSSHAVSLVVGGGGTYRIPHSRHARRAREAEARDAEVRRALAVASRARARTQQVLRQAGGDVLPPEAPAGGQYTQSLTVTGRRVFHWDVAIKRNLLSLACLSFVSMWVLLLDSMYPAPLVPAEGK